MKLIVCGAGVIGSNLAKYLSEERHEVTLIEQKTSVADRVTEKLDARVISGSAFEPATLLAAGAASADMVIAVTNSDVVNLAICSLAAALGTRKRIARVRDLDLSELVERQGSAHFHVDEIITPEEVAAQTIVKMMEAPGSREVADFADGKILLRSFNVPPDSPLIGEQLGNLRESDFPWPFLMVAINRDGKVIIPRGSDTVEGEDRIYVLLPRPSLAEFLTFVHPSVRLPKKIVIYGATSTGTSLARSLSEKIPDVVLLEENRPKAEKVAGQLTHVKVINGLASDADILRECGVEAADAYIAVSTSDHHNLISAVLAKQMGAKTTVITTHQPDYAPIVAGLGIDAVINPRLLATDQILRLVRGSRISHVARLPEVKAEVLELIPEPGSPVTKKEVKDLKIPKNAIIGAVHNGEDAHLVEGKTQIKEGEAVVVFCRADVVPQVEKLFAHRSLI
jgi:trk system potassium uptake protein TrkA